MYAWLVLITCPCWRLLLALRESFTPAQVRQLRALPDRPGVFASAWSARCSPHSCWQDSSMCAQTFGGPRRWLAVHVAVAILILPWIGNYFDHPPEFLSERLPLRFLLGTPIGFIGGNSLLLLGLVALIAFGILCQARDPAEAQRRIVPALLLCWLILPPVALYVYSWLFHPVFGPARYTVFVAPAYLVLVAAGLSRLPAWARYPTRAGAGASSRQLRSFPWPTTPPSRPTGAISRRARRHPIESPGPLDPGDRGISRSQAQRRG